VVGQLRAVEGRFDAAAFAVHTPIPVKKNCGFGAELAPIFGLLAMWHRRIARRRKG
jgi:hypothetical protein